MGNLTGHWARLSRPRLGHCPAHLLSKLRVFLGTGQPPTSQSAPTSWEPFICKVLNTPHNVIILSGWRTCLSFFYTIYFQLSHHNDLGFFPDLRPELQNVTRNFAIETKTKYIHLYFVFLNYDVDTFTMDKSLLREDCGVLSAICVNHKPIYNCTIQSKITYQALL